MSKEHSFNLRNMTFLEVKQLAKTISGKTNEELAEAIGVGHEHVARHFRAADYNLSPIMLPKLCRALGNNLQIEWQNVQVGALFLTVDRNNPKDVSIPSQMSRVNDAVTDAVNAAMAAMEDGHYEPVELVDMYDKLARARVKLESAMMAIQLKSSAVEGRA